MPQTIANNINTAAAGRLDHDIILRLVRPGSRVLDLGCGSGELLARLVREKAVVGQGVEISPDNIGRCMGKGVAAIQGDVDEGLADYPDASFDYVVLNQTLQVVKSPDRVLVEMVRVGKTGIVGFPNFGHWRVRLDLLLRGRMPMTRDLPDPWYSTPNIHLLTIKDFEELCVDRGIRIVERVFLASAGEIKPVLPNLRAVQALYLVRRNGQ